MKTTRPTPIASTDRRHAAPTGPAAPVPMLSPDARAALAAAVTAGAAPARALLETLVNMPSGSYEAANVNAVGDRLAAAWAPLGFTDRRDPVSDPLSGRGDIRLLTRPCGGAGGRVLILGHLDTVWPASDCAGWRYAEADGLATGPGVGDMKGGLVMAWQAVSALLGAGLPLPSEIAVLLVPDEEIGSPGSRARIEAEALASRCVLVLEPSRPDGSVVLGRGAVGAMVLTAHGRSAHVGVNPAEGASALLPLAALAGRISALGGEDPATGASIGILRAGAARQVVPDLAEMHVDLRAGTGAGAEALEAGIRALAAEAEAADPRIRIEIAGGVTRPAFPAAMGETLFALYAAHDAADPDATPPAAVVTRGGSDGSFGAALGVPTLDGIGPVCFETCSRRERIRLDSLDRQALRLAALIAELALRPDLPLLR